MSSVAKASVTASSTAKPRRGSAVTTGSTNASTTGKKGGAKGKDNEPRLVVMTDAGGEVDLTPFRSVEGCVARAD